MALYGPETFIESAFSESFSSYWTDGDKALVDDDDYAYIQAKDQDVRFYGTNLAGIPDGAPIIGIRVLISGCWSSDSGTTTNPYLDVALSWNGGTNWTSTKDTYFLLDDAGGPDPPLEARRTYYIGGPTDTWGRSWATTEIKDPNSFVVRVRSRSGSALIDTPEWRISYVFIAVYYDNSGTNLTATVYDGFKFRDETDTGDLLTVEVNDRFDLFDAGTSGRKAWSIHTEMASASGTAITSRRSSAIASFSAAASPQRAEGAFVWLIWANFSMFVGDATACSANMLAEDADDTYKLIQPGLISIDSITYTGEFGEQKVIATGRIILANRKYTEIVGNTTAKYMAEHLQGQNPLGGSCIVYVCVKGSSAWYKHVIFDGKITNIDLNDESIGIDMALFSNSETPVPDQTINENTFYYNENTYSSVQGLEGNKIEERIGAVIPIGIGRFDYSAVKNSWPAGHPFLDTSINDVMAIGVIPASLGYKFPMMPAVAAVRNWDRPQSRGSGSGGALSPSYQLVYLHGSRRGRPLHIGYGANDDINTFEFGHLDWSDINTEAALRQQTLTTTICTWVKDEQNQINQAAFFVKDMSPRSWSGHVYFPNYKNHYHFQSAGSLSAAVRLTGRPYSSGESQDAYAVFVNISPNVGLAEYPYSPGALQCLFVPFVAELPNVGPTKGINFARTGTVLYPDEARRHGDLLTYTALVESTPGARAAVVYQVPTKLPNPGDLWGIRVAGITSPTNTGTLKMNGRFCGPDQNGCHMLWIHTYTNRIIGTSMAYGEDQHHAVNTVFVNGQVDPDDRYDQDPGNYVKMLTTSSHTYFAWWILPPWWYPPPVFALQAQPSRFVFDKDATIYPYYRNGASQSLINEAMVDTDVAMTVGFQDDVGGNYPQTIPYPWVVYYYLEDGAACFSVIHKTWVELIYKSKIAQKTTVVGDFSRADTGFRYVDTRIRTPIGNRRTGYWYDPSKSPWIGYRAMHKASATVDEPPTGDVFLIGVTQPEKAARSGGYLSVIEYPPEVAGLILEHYSPRAYQDRATSTSFGSFDTAQTILEALGIRMTIVVDRQSTLGEVLTNIGKQSMSFFDEQVTEDGQIQYRMFVDRPSFSGGDARLYKTNGYFFGPVDIELSQFEVSLSDISKITNNIKLRYGWHIPTGTWSGERFINRFNSNLDTESDEFVIAAGDSYRQNGRVENQQVVEFPDIWDPAAADVLTKWLFNTQWKRRVLVEFSTFVRHSDLRVGHVITFSDDMAQIVPYPGLVGSSSWSAHQFNVVGVSYSKDVDGFTRVRVLAEETYTPAV